MIPENDALRRCRLFLFDLDGTLYLSNEPAPGAVDFLHRLRERGLGYVYLTNNSSLYSLDYIPKLRAMGFPCEAEDIMTAGQATAMFLAESRPGASVFPVGTKDFRRELSERGIGLSDGGEADVVCVGMDWELSYEKLTRAINLIRDGAEYIAANADLTCPVKGGVIPDTASICALISAATGRQPRFIGKPDKSIAELASRRFGLPREQMCCVGDRLYTDIAVGKNAGTLTALVLTGETDTVLYEASDVKADYVFPSVRELHEYFGE